MSSVLIYLFLAIRRFNDILAQFAPMARQTPRRQDQRPTVPRSVAEACQSNQHRCAEVVKVDHEKVVRDFHEKLTLDMDNHSCSEARDDFHAFLRQIATVACKLLTLQL